MDCRTHTSPSDHEIEITAAALSAYGHLFRAVGRMIRTHAAGDGGLICEDRTVPAKPVVWRICPDGVVMPDRLYSFAERAFTAAVLPPSLRGAKPGEQTQTVELV